MPSIHELSLIFIFIMLIPIGLNHARPRALVREKKKITLAYLALRFLAGVPAPVADSQDAGRPFVRLHHQELPGLVWVRLFSESSIWFHCSLGNPSTFAA